MAADHPQAIERAVMIGSDIPGVTPAVSIFLPKNDNAHSWHFMFNPLDDLPELLAQGCQREFLSWGYTKLCVQAAGRGDGRSVRAYSVPGAMLAGFVYYRAFPAIIEQNVRRMRTRLLMPILAVGGEFGTGDKAEASLRPLAGRAERCSSACLWPRHAGRALSGAARPAAAFLQAGRLRLKAD